MDNDNFFAIDRLVQFGLGMGVAQQMVRSMNNALQNTTIPGPQGGPAASASPAYFAVIEGKQAGPFAAHELVRLISEGKVAKGSLVWRPGMASWDAVENVPDVLRLVALAPPPLPK